MKHNINEFSKNGRVAYSFSHTFHSYIIHCQLLLDFLPALPTFLVGWFEVELKVKVLLLPRVLRKPGCNKL